MLFLPAAIKNTFLVAGLFSSIADKIKQALDGILSNVIQGVAGSLYQAAIRGIATLTNLFLMPLGMNMTTFNTIIPSGQVFYKIVLWFGVIVATLILIWQLFKTLFLKKEGEHPVRLIARYALTIFFMFASTTIFDAALGVANVPYTALSQYQKDYDAEYAEQHNSTITNFITSILSGNHDQADYDSLNARYAINGDKLVDNGEDIVEAVFLEFNTVDEDDFDGETTSSNIGERVSGWVGYTLLSVILSLLFIIFIVINYIKLLVECIERYVVLGVLYYVSPLPLAAGVSEETRQIRGSWIRMCISQILVIFFSLWFLRGFTWAYGNAVASIVSKPKYTVFYLGMVVAFLKVGQHVDEYMGILGMSTAKTGRGLMEDASMVMIAMRSAGSVMRRSGGGGSDKGGRGNTPDAASVYNPIDPRKTPQTVTGKKAESQFRAHMTGLNPNMQLSDMKVSKGHASAIQHFPDGSKREVSWRKATDSEIQGAMNGTKPRKQNEEWVTAKDGSRHLQTTHAPKSELEAAMKSGSGISDYSLNGRTETGLNLSHGNLSGVNADNSTLQNLNVSSSAVKDTTANGAQLHSMDASHTTFDNFEAKGAVMPDLKANDSHIKNSDLSGAQMPAADLANSEISRSDLTGANLAGADLSGNTTLSGNNMTDMAAPHMTAEGCTWTDNNAAGADFREANLKEAKGRNNTFDGANFVDADCFNMEMDSSSFNGVQARGAHMEASVLTGNTTMYTDKGKPTDFHDAYLSGCEWTGIKGADANFEGADLCGSHITDSVIKHTSFAGAKFDDLTSFAGTDLSGCNFAGTNLAGVDFTGCNFTGAIMPDGRLYDPERNYGNSTIKPYPKPEKMKKDKDDQNNEGEEK